MVDVSDKSITKRSATATGRIFIPLLAYELVTASYPSKVSRETSNEAAIMGSKKTSDLIPLCHPLPLTNVQVNLTCETLQDLQGTTRYSIACRATVTCEGKTGVEMEALTAVSVGLLTVWDMLKAVAGKEMVIGEILVSEKSGGKSGGFCRAPASS